LLAIIKIKKESENMKEKRYGYLGVDGQWIVKPQLISAACDYREGLARITIDSSVGFFDKDGNQVLPSGAQYYAGASGFTRIEIGDYDVDIENYEMYFIDNNGNRVDSEEVPTYETSGYYVDMTGKIVISPIVSRNYSTGGVHGEGDFSEGLAAAMMWNTYDSYRRWGFIDCTGNLVIEPLFQVRYHRHDCPSRFSEGLADVSLAVDGDNAKKGYIDRTGKFVIPPQFDYAGEFSEGVAVIGMIIGYKRSEGGDEDAVDSEIVRMGYVNLQGKLIAEPQFYKCEDAHEGRCIVENDDGYGCLDTEGNWIVKPQYWDMQKFSEGLVATAIDQNEWGFLDLAGKVAINFQFEEATPFYEGLAGVKIGGKWGFIDRGGNVAIEPQYDYLHMYPDGTFPNYGHELTKVGFSNGLALVIQDEKGFFINTSGNIAIPGKFEYAQKFEQGRTLIINWTEEMCAVGFMDTFGHVVYIPTEYEGLRISCNYESATTLTAGFMQVWVDKEVPDPS
jgi:WG containing repeat